MNPAWYVLATDGGFVGLDPDGHKTPALAIVPDIDRASPWLGRDQAAEASRRAAGILGARCEAVRVKFVRVKTRAGRDVTVLQRA